MRSVRISFRTSRTTLLIRRECCCTSPFCSHRRSRRMTSAACLFSLTMSLRISRNSATSTPPLASIRCAACALLRMAPSGRLSSGARVAKITVPVLHVVGPESLGNKRLDLTANELLTGVTEDGLRLGVNQGDAAFCVHHDQGARRRLHH